MSKKLFAALLALSLSGGALQAEKQKEGRFEKMKQELNLTPEQEKKLKDHRKKHQEQTKAIREEVKKKREAMRQELDKPQADISRVRSIHSEIKGLEGKLSDQRLEGILAMREILTPEQRQKFQEKMKHMKKGKGMRDGGKRDWGRRSKHDKTDK